MNDAILHGVSKGRVFRIGDERLHAVARCLGVEPRARDDSAADREVAARCRLTQTYGDGFGVNGTAHLRRGGRVVDPTPWDP